MPGKSHGLRSLVGYSPWRRKESDRTKRLHFMSPLDNKEIKPVNCEGNQPWLSIERNDAEAPILWPPDVKTLMLGQDWRLEKGVTEDKMIGWQPQLNGHEFEQTAGDGEGQGSLAYTIHGAANNRIWLSNWTTNFCRHDHLDLYGTCSLPELFASLHSLLSIISY